MHRKRQGGAPAAMLQWLLLLASLPGFSLGVPMQNATNSVTPAPSLSEADSAIPTINSTLYCMIGNTTNPCVDFGTPVGSVPDVPASSASPTAFPAPTQLPVSSLSEEAAPGINESTSNALAEVSSAFSEPESEASDAWGAISETISSDTAEAASAWSEQVSSVLSGPESAASEAWGTISETISSATAELASGWNEATSKVSDEFSPASSEGAEPANEQTSVASQTAVSPSAVLVATPASTALATTGIIAKRQEPSSTTVMPAFSETTISFPTEDLGSPSEPTAAVSDVASSTPSAEIPTLGPVPATSPSVAAVGSTDVADPTTETTFLSSEEVENFSASGQPAAASQGCGALSGITSESQSQLAGPAGWSTTPAPAQITAAGAKFARRQDPGYVLPDEQPETQPQQQPEPTPTSPELVSPTETTPSVAATSGICSYGEGAGVAPSGTTDAGSSTLDTPTPEWAITQTPDSTSV